MKKAKPFCQIWQKQNIEREPRFGIVSFPGRARGPAGHGRGTVARARGAAVARARGAGLVGAGLVGAGPVGATLVGATLVGADRTGRARQILCVFRPDSEHGFFLRIRLYGIFCCSCRFIEALRDLLFKVLVSSCFGC